MFRSFNAVHQWTLPRGRSLAGRTWTRIALPPTTSSGAACAWTKSSFSHGQWPWLERPLQQAYLCRCLLSHMASNRIFTKPFFQRIKYKEKFNLRLILIIKEKRCTRCNILNCKKLWAILNLNQPLLFLTLKH